MLVLAQNGATRCQLGVQAAAVIAKNPGESTRPAGLEPATPGLGNRCWPLPAPLKRPSRHRTPTNDRLATGYLPTVEGALLGAPCDGALLQVLDHLLLPGLQPATVVSKNFKRTRPGRARPCSHSRQRREPP